MVCEKIQAPDGTVFIACKKGRGRPRRPCFVCKKKPHEVLCDGKGCDKPMCRDCAHHVEPDQDFCPECWKVESAKPKQETLL